ncbi:hypothetical protein PHLCEN_2v6951 [Hermanssonia centrifuga]|uniref:Uncharacterized protein n=1 Tax=Hermanssonia centrifuga TaxID=98765 RepID=A0A2R6NY05_9APHY|nr:hypothetical protein PHLCEN_2v6951 [Hermanssonia centrifuga]
MIRDTSSNNGLTLVFDWVKGWDRGLFESFMSHVGRKVEIALESENAATV